MATVSTLSQLIAALNGADADKNPHAWLHADHGLVVGTFPTPGLAYDFGSERLNALTRQMPEPKKRESLVHLARRVSDRYEIETADSIYELGSATHALLWGLEYIERQAPGTLDKLAREKGRSKRAVSRNLEDLYDLPSQRRFAEQISTGHFVATNNKAGEALGYVRRAARLAGLSEDQFSVRWKPPRPLTSP